MDFALKAPLVEDIVAEAYARLVVPLGPGWGRQSSVDCNKNLDKIFALRQRLWQKSLTELQAERNNIQSTYDRLGAIGFV